VRGTSSKTGYKSIKNKISKTKISCMVDKPNGETKKTKSVLRNESQQILTLGEAG
jgi:hypothetical protein